MRIDLAYPLAHGRIDESIVYWRATPELRHSSGSWDIIV